LLNLLKLFNIESFSNWVLGKFKPVEKDSILESFYKFNNIIELLSNNDMQNAQLKLHTE
jgi:peptidyl-tRNA hydrolase